MKTKNILIICPFFKPNIGGVESHLDLLTKYLVQQKYQTTVLTYKPLTIKIKQYKKIEKTKNLKIIRFWWFGNKIFDKTTPIPLLQFIYITPGLLWNTFFYIQKNHKKIDIIHAHGFAAGFIVSFCSLFFKLKKIVISTHYIYPNLNTKNISTKILKWTFNRFNKIFVVSNKSGQQLQKIGINPNKIIPYKHWINSKLYKPNNQNNHKTILFVGRIIKTKGVFLLLEVAKKMPQINFNIVGDGPDFELLKNKSVDIKNFNLLGKKKAEEIIYFYQNSDFTILPSITSEGQPMVVMESLMCGTPVITTNKGSVVEMYNSNIGISVKPKTEDITKIIIDLYKNPKKIFKMKKNSRIFAIKNFSEKNAFNIIKNY